MKAAIKQPGMPWVHEDVKPKIEYLNEVCEGYIELVPNFHTNAIMYCNEEGKMLGFKPNFYIYETEFEGEPLDLIVGPVIMFGPSDDEGNETDLTMELFEKTIKCIEAV